MTRDPETVGPDMPLRTATEMMQSKRIRHLPVINGSGGLVGILTDRDLKHGALVPLLAQHLGWESQRLKAPRVRDVMTWSVITTGPSTSLIQAALTMFQRRIGSLPVVESGRLVGILTETDVFRGLGKEPVEGLLW